MSKPVILVSVQNGRHGVAVLCGEAEIVWVDLGRLDYRDGTAQQKLAELEALDMGSQPQVRSVIDAIHNMIVGGIDIEDTDRCNGRHQYRRDSGLPVDDLDESDRYAPFEDDVIFDRADDEDFDCADADDADCDFDDEVDDDDFDYVDDDDDDCDFDDEGDDDDDFYDDDDCDVDDDADADAVAAVTTGYPALVAMVCRGEHRFPADGNAIGVRGQGEYQERRCLDCGVKADWYRH